MFITLRNSNINTRIGLMHMYEVNHESIYILTLPMVGAKSDA